MHIRWLVPWHPIESDDERRGLLDEFQREVGRDHPLADIAVSPIARRQDCDDVLFSVADGRVAIVHLTWSGKTESNSELPIYHFFDSLEIFVEESMKPEHQRWRSFPAS